MTNQEAIERIQSIKSKVSLYVDVLALRMAEEALKNQKTGHWIEIDDYPHEDFECDCCGGKVYGTEEPYEEYKYCPNCGAKMEGDKE